MRRPDLLSEAEVAELLLGISVQSVRRLVAAGELRLVGRRSGETGFDPRAVHAYLEGLLMKPGGLAWANTQCWDHARGVVPSPPRVPWPPQSRRRSG